MNRTLDLLTICKKAGKLITGMDSVKDSCRNKEAKCVLVASDLSAKSIKEIFFVCDRENVKVYNLDASIDDVWSSLGKKSGIIGICDNGFTKKLSTMLTPLEKE